MADRDVLAHNPDYSSQIDAVRAWVTVGENVGLGTSTVGSLHQSFMDSAAHRTNILGSDYTRVTVGCIRDSSARIWVTQNFWG